MAIGWNFDDPKSPRPSNAPKAKELPLLQVRSTKMVNSTGEKKNPATLSALHGVDIGKVRLVHEFRKVSHSSFG